MEQYLANDSEKSLQKEKKVFAQKIYAGIAAIPKGKVAAYGQLALLAGRPRWARMAGKVLSMAPEGLPCHRVVASDGRLVPGWDEQRARLLEEGVVFHPNGKVDMKKCRWRVE